MIQVLHRLQPSGVVCVSFAPPVYYFIAKKVRLGVIHKCVDQRGLDLPYKKLFLHIVSKKNMKK